MNRVDFDLRVGMYSIPKKGIVYYYEPSKPDTWLQSLPVNIGANAQLGCPQAYNMIYVEALNTTMDGALAGEIVNNARLACWTWNKSVGMYTLRRPNRSASTATAL